VADTAACQTRSVIRSRLREGARHAAGPGACAFHRFATISVKLSAKPSSPTCMVMRYALSANVRSCRDVLLLFCLEANSGLGECVTAAGDCPGQPWKSGEA
jgi:hypothetical protein